MASLTSLGNPTSAEPSPGYSVTNPFGLDPNSSSYGNDTNAALSLHQWGRSQALYQPLEDILFGMAESSTGRSDAMNTARQMASRSLGRSEDAFERQSRGLGLTLTSQQQQAYERRSDVTAGLTRVGAANTAASNYDALRRIIFGG